MTNEDALTLIFICLDALVHHELCLQGKTKPSLPVELLRRALRQMEEMGANTRWIRERFVCAGIDFPAASQAAQTESPPSGRRTSWNRVGDPIREAACAKFQGGWTKSRIAREFRLNRRTVIRICAGA